MVQVSAEVSGQWHWSCQPGSGLASKFFGTTYQHFNSISLPVPKHGWAFKSAVWEPVYKTMKSILCCSVRLFIIQFWEVVTLLFCLVHTLSPSLINIYACLCSCACFLKSWKNNISVLEIHWVDVRMFNILEPSRSSFIIVGRVENQHSPKAP